MSRSPVRFWRVAPIKTRGYEIFTILVTPFVLHFVHSSSTRHLNALIVEPLRRLRGLLDEVVCTVQSSPPAVRPSLPSHTWSFARRRDSRRPARRSTIAGLRSQVWLWRRTLGRGRLHPFRWHGALETGDLFWSDRRSILRHHYPGHYGLFVRVGHRDTSRTIPGVPNRFTRQGIILFFLCDPRLNLRRSRNLLSPTSSQVLILPQALRTDPCCQTGGDRAQPCPSRLAEECPSSPCG